MNSRGPCVQLPSGRAWYPNDPGMADVSIRDIAHNLANVSRFGGSCARFYSVAEHSLHCARVARSMGLPRLLQLEALLHDAHEAYPPGDILGPVVKLLPDAAAMSRKAELAVRSAFDLPYVMSSEIKTIDLRMLATEKRDLMPPPEGWDWWHGRPPPEPYPFNVDRPWYERSNDLSDHFLDMFRALSTQ